VLQTAHGTPAPRHSQASARLLIRTMARLLECPNLAPGYEFDDLFSGPPHQEASLIVPKQAHLLR
jgi:hypothetical protein